MNATLTPGQEHSLLARLEELETQVHSMKMEQSQQPTDTALSLVCFSGEWDKLYAGLTIASGALAMGKEVNLFFTFWACTALKRPETKPVPKPGDTFLTRLLAWFLPKHVEETPLSKMNYLGMGKVMMNRRMKQVGAEPISVLLDDIRELGANLYLCDTSAELLGIGQEDLIQGCTVQPCGVATFMKLAQESKTVLFI